MEITSKNKILSFLLLVALMNTACKKESEFESDDFICGSELIDSRDGNIYATVQIGNQCWMSENLAFLPEVHNKLEFEQAGQSNEPSFGVFGYNGSSAEDAKKEEAYNLYGVLYNWYAASNNEVAGSHNKRIRGICPQGWFLPSDNDWTILSNYLAENGYNYDGSYALAEWSDNEKLQKIGKALAAQSHWRTSNSEGAIGNDLSLNNKSGFNALPACSRIYDGTYEYMRSETMWWSSTMNNERIYIRQIHFFTSQIWRGLYPPSNGISVRCVREYK